MNKLTKKTEGTLKTKAVEYGLQLGDYFINVRWGGYEQLTKVSNQLEQLMEKSLYYEALLVLENIGAFTVSSQILTEMGAKKPEEVCYFLTEALVAMREYHKVIFTYPCQDLKLAEVLGIHKAAMQLCALFAASCNLHFQGELELNSIVSEMVTQMRQGKYEHAYEVFIRVCNLLNLDEPDCVAVPNPEKRKCFLQYFVTVLPQKPMEGTEL